jgi:hypothetical protein
MKVVSLTKIKEVENELINNLLNCNQENQSRLSG